MENLIDSARGAGDTMQALFVSAGGLIGVFATLTVFFLIIWLADKLGGRKQGG
ncbi:MAG TPA: hypothetical protein PK625_06185 [Spirochaetales bacterium]|nr:hypothetical protein [Spirochaetales bacterium]MBP7262906.1 hypothetical protein [Spirochaetia bacterium]HPE36721.1 hypothetical protein [Spirochaetales bacterium]